MGGGSCACKMLEKFKAILEYSVVRAYTINSRYSRHGIQRDDDLRLGLFPFSCACFFLSFSNHRSSSQRLPPINCSYVPFSVQRRSKPRYMQSKSPFGTVQLISSRDCCVATSSFRSDFRIVVPLIVGHAEGEGGLAFPLLGMKMMFPRLRDKRVHWSVLLGK